MPENPLTRASTNGDHRTNNNLPVDHVFDRARQLIEISGILSVLRRWRDDDREPGRYEVGGAINDYAVLTAWLIAAIERRVPQHQVLAEILFERLDTEHRLALDIRDDGFLMAPRRTAAVGRALHRILSPIDPFPTSRSRRHTFEEALRAIEEHDKELESRRSARLDELTTRLIAASVLHAVHKSLELYVATDVVIIPGPALPANGWRGLGARGGNAGVSDPFAAALPNPSRRAHLDGPLWGWKAHLAVLTLP
ncbi:hypothetical protein ACFQ9V_13275 [Leifsonia sp. NPDC056665]|uniref:hypothetical protein n=1 Tax=Leifsonia sp. NPDC056665 TaxID=3345901 RepID=UPI0036CF6906